MVQPKGCYDLRDDKYDYDRARDWQYEIPNGASGPPNTINVRVKVKLRADPGTPAPGPACLRTVHWF